MIRQREDLQLATGLRSARLTLEQSRKIDERPVSRYWNE